MNLKDLASLSEMLDDAFELEGIPLEEWFSHLSRDRRRFERQLRRMLAARHEPTRADFLAECPRLVAPEPGRLTAGQCVGRYRLLSEIGRGGMGVVWLAEAEHDLTGRRVALKLPRLLLDDSLASRLESERRIGVLLEHPRIARLYDAGIDEKVGAFLAFEYLEGQDLIAWCSERKVCNNDRVALFIQVVEAVAYAHAQLVVHGDVKPSNILVDASGIHLLDFGVATLLNQDEEEWARSSSAPRRATIRYAAPELLKGAAANVTADIYSLGVVLAELLGNPRTGQDAGENGTVVAQPHWSSSKVAPPLQEHRELGRDIHAILNKCRAVRSANRYQSAESLATDLKRVLSHECVSARPQTWMYRCQMLVRKNLVLSCLSCVALTLLIGAFAATLTQKTRADSEAGRARAAFGFVMDSFKVSAPDQPAIAEARIPAAEALITRSGDAIATRYADRPALEAELYGVTGKILADLGAHGKAIDYLSRQLTLVERLRVARPEIGQVRIAMAESQLGAGRAHEAVQVLTAAAEDLAGRPEALAHALVLLARALRSDGQPEKAREALDRADTALSNVAKPTIDTAKAAETSAMLVFTGGDRAKGLSLMQAAIKQAADVEGPASETAAEIEINLTRMLAAQRDVNAKTFLDHALARMTQVGGAGLLTAALTNSSLSQRLYLFGLMPFRDAIQANDQSSVSLQRLGTLPSAAAKASIAYDRAKDLILWGDLINAQALMKRSVAVFELEPPNFNRHFNLLLYHGALLTLLGRHSEAERICRDLIELRRRAGEAQTELASGDFICVAENQMMRGDFDQAEKTLNEALVRQPRDAPFSAPYERHIREARARVRLERGDAHGALSLLDGVESLPTKLVFRDPAVLKGEALCRAGRRGEGLATLQAAFASSVDWTSPDHPELARAEAAAARCAKAENRPDLAQRWHDEALRAFRQQPDVAKYFKESFTY